MLETSQYGIGCLAIFLIMGLDLSNPAERGCQPLQTRFVFNDTRTYVCKVLFSGSSVMDQIHYAGLSNRRSWLSIHLSSRSEPTHEKRKTLDRHQHTSKKYKNIDTAIIRGFLPTSSCAFKNNGFCLFVRSKFFFGNLLFFIPRFIIIIIIILFRNRGPKQQTSFCALHRTNAGWNHLPLLRNNS